MNWQTSRQTNLIWKTFWKKLSWYQLIYERKKILMELDCSQFPYLTFPTEFKTEYDRMDGCARAVNEHFSITAPDLPILICTDFVKKTILNPKTNQIQFRTKWGSFDNPVYFPFWMMIFFLNITCLNTIFKRSEFKVTVAFLQGF